MEQPAEALSPVLRFGVVGAPDLPRRIDQLRTSDRLTALTGAEVLLDVEADFAVQDGGRVVFAEPSFPVAELAWALGRWVPAQGEPADDFRFDSMAYDVPGAVQIIGTEDGWTIGSCFAATTTAPHSWATVHQEVRGFVDAIKAATAVAVRDATGSMITSILTMHRAFDMPLAEGKAFVVDAVGGIDPVNRRLHDVAESYLKTGLLGMRVTVVAGGTRALEVLVDSPAGRLRGAWDGPMPGVGETTDIEVETGGPCSWADTLFVPDGASLAADDDRSWLRGVVERIDPDGVLILRSGPAVTSVDMIGVPLAGAVGRSVAIPVSGVRFFPTGT